MPFFLNGVECDGVSLNGTSLDDVFLNGTLVFTTFVPTHYITVAEDATYLGFDVGWPFHAGSISPAGYLNLLVIKSDSRANGLQANITVPGGTPEFVDKGSWSPAPLLHAYFAANVGNTVGVIIS